jgi:hypothetical protein
MVKTIETAPFVCVYPVYVFLRTCVDITFMKVSLKRIVLSVLSYECIKIGFKESES